MTHAGTRPVRPSWAEQVIAFTVEGVITFDRTMHVRAMNASAARIFRLAPELAIGQHVSQFIPLRYHSSHDELVSAFVSTGDSAVDMTSHRSVVARRSDGIEITVEVSIVRAEDDDGESLFVALIRDITAREEAEDRLRRSEERLSEAQRIAHLGNWDWNILTNDLWWSDEIYNIFGLAPREFDATYPAFLDRIHPDDRAAVEAAVNDAVDNGAPYNINHRVVRPSGEIRIVHERGRVTRNAAGRPVRMIGTVQDVTEMRRVEMGLRDSEAELRAIFDSTNVGIVFLDHDRNVVNSNERARQIGLEVTGLELRSGVPLASFMPPAVQRRFDWLATPPPEGQRTTRENEVVDLQGRRRWFETSYSTVTVEGAVRGVLLITHETTDRHEAEDGLRQSEAELSAVFEASPLSVVVLDENRRLVRSNRTARKTMSDFGLAPSVGSDYLESVRDDLRESVAASIAQAQAGNVQEVERTLTDAHGALRIFETAYSPILLRGGALHGVVIRSREITERRQAELNLRESEAELNAIFEASPLAIALLGTDRRLLRINETARTMMRDLEASPQVGQDYMATMRPDIRLRMQPLIQQTLEGKVIEVERTVVDAQSVQRTWETVYSPVRMETGEIHGVVIISREVTEKKKTEEALVLAQKMESLGVLAGGIAHDFNNLLVGILGNAGLALAETEAGSPLRDPLQQIALASQRAADLARQMLAYAGRAHTVASQVEINALLSEMGELLFASLGKGVRLQRDFAPTPIAVEADATQLRQVIMNLVVNASDAIGSEQGSISLRTAELDIDAAAVESQAFIGGCRPGRYALLEVADTGCGMDAETLARMFDPFFTTKQRGHGLGLAAVLGIVRAHNGALSVSSEATVGTTIRIYLPLSSEAAPVQQPPATRHEPWRGHGLILVADDEPMVRTVTSRGLARLGFEVVEVVDGHEAVQAFEARAAEVRLVIMDMTMPRMGGLDAARAINALRPEVPIVIMSGYDESDAAAETEIISRFVQKPFSLGELTTAIRETLER